MNFEVLEQKIETAVKKAFIEILMSIKMKRFMLFPYIVTEEL